MRTSNTQTLGEVIREYLNACGLNSKLKEMRVLQYWPDVVGIAIANKTSRMIIKNRVLFVYMNSSIARTELSYLKRGLVKALNDRAKEQVIDDIVIK